MLKYLAMELKRSKCISPAGTIRGIVIRHFGCKAHGNCCGVRPSGPDGAEAFGINQPISRENNVESFLRTFLI